MSNYTSTLWAKLYEEQLDNNDANDMESTTKSDIELPPRNVSQRWRLYSHHAKRRVFERFSKWCPKTTATSNLFIYLKTDQTFPEFVLKSIIGFFGGIVLTYLCFVFFVFQLSISLIHATIISSIIGVLLTFGLAFSYRIRCLVFLLIPQMFSRVGRYTLTCYALVLILTGPATNTLKNSEVLTESMACTQEQIKTNVKQIADSAKNPLNSMKDTIKVMMARLNGIANKVDGLLAKINRLVNGIVDVLQSSYSWFHIVAKKCNIKFGTPYEHCVKVLTRKDSQNKELDEQGIPILPNTSHILKAVCSTIKSESNVCKVADFAEVSIAATLKRRLRTFINHVKTMFFIKIYTHQSYIFTNNSRSPGQVTAGIVTEIRNRADPLLTWLSWSSYVTSLFLLLIIFRAKYYQHMYETRSRFDNRYITKELRELNSQRLQEGRETILPLNRRERVKYVTTTSFRLVASERVHLTRSLLFMAITTFKLMIHMIADYSLYWVLMTIRYHGKRQTPLRPGPADAGIIITGTGLIADMIRSILRALTGPLTETSSLSCLPNPYPPDLRRYTQIGILIFLLWFFALFEPYGLRLRHLIMGHYRPERAKIRALWLYNHILRTRGSFMKFARRKLHKEYKYLPEDKLTFRYWLQTHIPFLWLRYILGISNKQPKCLLCNAKELKSNTASELIRCQSQGCPGTFCNSCFTDMGRLCTICLTPVDYGDFSDISLAKGSSEDSRDSSSQSDDDNLNLQPKPKYFFKPKKSDKSDEQDRLLGNLRKGKIKKPRFYSLNKINDNQDTEQLLSNSSDDDCEKERTNRRYVVSNALDLTHFSVPHSNITVGYVYQSYFCHNKHGKLPFRTLKSKGNDNDSEPCYKSSKNNYGTFIKSTSEQESVTKSKENYAQNKISAKVIRKRDIIKILGTLQRKYKIQLKKRSKTFKINRRTSHNYYQQQLKALPNIVQSRFSRSFNCFSLPIRLSNVQYVTLNRNRRKTKKFPSVAAAHKLHLKENINSRKAIQNTTFDSNKKNRAQSSKNIQQIKSETNLPYESGKQNENARNNANKRSPETKNLKKKQHNENKRRCSCVIKLRKLFFMCFSQLNVALKGKQASQKRLTKTTRKYLKQANNYKRRKKHLNNTLKKDSGIKLIHNTKTDIELTRQYRIYTFLKEGDWIKGRFERNSNSKGNINIVENDQDCYINVKAEFQKIREKYKNKNIQRNHKKIEKEECPCIQNICCGCKETCKSNKLENEKQLEKDNTGNPMAPTKSSAAQSKESIAPQGDETCRIKSIDHFHVPVLSKSHSYIEQYENDVEPHDVNKFSPSVKSFSIRNVKLYISKKFLHMQFRNPITTLKNILSSSMSIIKNKISTSNVTLFEKEKPYYVDKSVTVLPMVVSRSCECMITKTPTNKYTEKYSPIKTLKLNQSNAKDQEIDIQKRECTCNTENLTNGRENEINKIGERFKGNAPYTNATTNKDLKSHTTDSTRTDTTICSYITVDFIDEVPRKHNVKVITKSNQSTATDRAELCDVSTVTSDWWSPILEKKEMNFNREGRRKNRERKSVRTSTDGRVVTFESRPHVIPSDNSYILSPSRYLLESQKYYNELFSPKLYAPHLLPAIRAGQKKKVNITANRANKNLFHKNKRILRTNEKLGRRSSGTVMRQRLYNIGSSRSDDTTSIFS